MIELAGNAFAALASLVALLVVLRDGQLQRPKLVLSVGGVPRGHRLMSSAPWKSIVLAALLLPLIALNVFKGIVGSNWIPPILGMVATTSVTWLILREDWKRSHPHPVAVAFGLPASAARSKSVLLLYPVEVANRSRRALQDVTLTVQVNARFLPKIAGLGRDLGPGWSLWEHFELGIIELKIGQVGPRQTCHILVPFGVSPGLPDEIGSRYEHTAVVAMSRCGFSVSASNHDPVFEPRTIMVVEAAEVDQLAKELVRAAAAAWDDKRPKPGTYWFLPFRGVSFVSRQLVEWIWLSLAPARVKESGAQLLQADLTSSEYGAIDLELPGWGFMGESAHLNEWELMGPRERKRRATGVGDARSTARQMKTITLNAGDIATTKD